MLMVMVLLILRIGIINRLVRSYCVLCLFGRLCVGLLTIMLTSCVHQLSDIFLRDSN